MQSFYFVFVKEHLSIIGKLYGINKRIIIGWQLLFFLFYTQSGIAQFNITIQTESFIDYCTELTIQIEIEKTQSSVIEDLVLEVQFSSPVNYVSNSLDLEAIDINPKAIRFELDDISDCLIQKGSLTVFPDCNDVFTNLETSLILKSDTDFVAEAKHETVIKNPFVDIEFSDYSYDAENEILTKNLTLFNAGSINIPSFYILPRIDQNFASLSSSSLGSIKNDTLFIDKSDLNGAVLSTGSEMIIELNYSINRCDIRTIDYELGYICQTPNCRTVQQFVDENDIYQNNVQGFLDSEIIGYGKRLNYGICEPIANSVIFKNSIQLQRTSIGNIYNIGCILQIDNRYTRRFNECIDLTASINGQLLNTELNTNNNSEHFIFFDNISKDPDGRGGIDDLDGDGQYDDIPLGDSTTFDVQLQLQDVCYENYENLEGIFSLIPTYSNYCQLMSNGRSSAVPESPILSNHFNVSFPPIDDFQRDQSNKRFLDNGKELTSTIRIRTSENVSEQCSTEELILTVDVPKKLQYDNTKDIIYYDNNDTLILIPNILNDTLLEFSFTELDSAQTFVDISFITVCDVETDTNYDNTADVCDQCVSYTLESIRAELSKPCNLNCSATAVSRQGRSAPFYTLCDDIPALEEPFVIEDLIIYNVSPGFIDKERTVKRDPFVNPSSINNKFFFDGDTMLIQVPFTFNCVQELQNYTILINENQLSLYDFEILESDIIIFDRNTNTELGSCPASLFLSQSDSQISFTFDQNSFNLPCIDPGEDHVLEVKLKFNYECTLSDQCRLAAFGILQVLSDITLLNGCSKRVFYNKDTIFINEVFKEEFFNPISDPFNLQTEIYDSIPMSFTLYPNVFSIKNADKEFKDYPILKEINYTIPEGYEIIGDLMLIETDFFFIDVVGFEIGDETTGDTLLRVQPTLVRKPDGSTEYQFKDIPSDYSNGSILKPVLGGLILKSVCQPSQNLQEITVSGIIEYVNYADDSRDRINFPFSKTENIEFLPERFDPIDDFQILESNISTTWTYQKNSFLFFSNLFQYGSNAQSPEQQYLFKYKSNGMQVDSITAFIGSGFEAEIITKTQMKNIFIGDSIIELILSPNFFLDQRGDTIYSDVDPSFFNFHTSSHACGFDTLSFELGRKSQFLNDTCENEIFSDIVVSYSPPGFPQLDFTKVPPDIKTFESNQFEFTLSNIGQGELIENIIYIKGLPEGNYELMQKNENDLVDISKAMEIVDDQLCINLDLVDLQQISGLSGFNISSIDFILSASDLCIEDAFLKLTAQAESLSYCGDTIISPLSKTSRLPYIIEEDLLFNIKASTFVSSGCQDTAYVSIRIQTDEVQQIDNPQIELIVPNDMFLYPNTVTVNGQIIADPITEPTDDDFSKLFIIRDGLPKLISDSILIDISFDGACIDLCREDEISVFMLSKLETSCVGNNVSQQSVTRAYSGNQKANWKSNLILENIVSALVDSKADNVILEIIGSISILNATNQRDAFFLYPFSDENLNDEFDEGELVFDQIRIEASRIESNMVELKDSINIPGRYLCSLALTTDINQNCVCNPSTVSIKQNGDVTFERIIQNCSTTEIPILFQYVDICNSTISSNPRLVPITDIIHSYQPDLGLLSDTIMAFNDCIGCEITERVIVRNSEPEISIDIENTEDCSISAEVTYNGTTNIPEQFQIRWNTGETTQKIDNIPIGQLTVDLIDQQSCSYADSIDVENDAALQYSIDITAGSCSDGTLGSASISVNGSASILWADGSVDFSRIDLDYGMYSFSLTNDIGCTEKDSFNLSPMGDLDFDVSITNANCKSVRSGKIEFISLDTSLRFSIDGQFFSKEKSYDSLTVGDYEIFARNERSCLDSMTVSLMLDEDLDSGINLFVNGAIDQELALNPNPIEEENLTWSWTSTDFNVSCADCPSPTLTIEGEGKVDLILTNEICTIEETITVGISLNNDIYSPNIFNPNSSVGNQLFSIYPNSSFDELDLAIFDRWGNQVFEIRNADLSRSREIGWDGRYNGSESIEGVYVYKAKVRRFIDDKEVEILGDFILVR